jgi:hypothetical protein
MEILLKKQWSEDPKLKRWSGRRCTHHKCQCNEPELVELWEQDGCVRGRIDTIVCVKCDRVKTFKIIR